MKGLVDTMALLKHANLKLRLEANLATPGDEVGGQGPHRFRRCNPTAVPRHYFDLSQPERLAQVVRSLVVH